MIKVQSFTLDAMAEVRFDILLPAGAQEGVEFVTLPDTLPGLDAQIDVPQLEVTKAGTDILQFDHRRYQSVMPYIGAKRPPGSLNGSSITIANRTTSIPMTKRVRRPSTWNPG